ncbi:IS3 family transposase [Flavobacterium hibernum]|uniref:Transposase n=1 Tax=Flavobacterium hibernum TaxID=37752 RepID=A0A0D0F8S6_9FLAO|nr:IS3 family transposase [Flavobacterium hibernum]KIO54427.1 transposase [Flavobacterium hibernum]OXA88101.1 transposase [Flavobacterium hibernum]STO10714.1 Integrase core domain [Flavobacterium hibernum]
MKKRKIYDRTFKENAVKLTYERGKSQTKVIAGELGITAKILSRWRQEYKKFGTGSFCGTGYLKLTPEQTIITNLEKKIKDSKITLEILKKGTESVSQGYVKTKDFIENNKSKFSIIKICNVLQVSRTTYYNRKNQELTDTETRIILYKEEITSIFYEFKKKYDGVKITKELQRRGFKIQYPSVKFYMKMLGLRSKVKRKFKVTTDSYHNHYVSPNVLNRVFTVGEPASAWVSDITYIQTIIGFMYLTIIMDLFDRKIIGWSLSYGMSTRQTTLRAWKMAVKNRKITKELIFHSDRGVQYANKMFTNKLDSYKLVRRSMSGRGNSTDNAVCESFFYYFKTELLVGNNLVSRKQMKIQVKEYIENWYNKKRRHSFLGYKTIEEFDEIYFNL